MDNIAAFEDYKISLEPPAFVGFSVANGTWVHTGSAIIYVAETWGKYELK